MLHRLKASEAFTFVEVIAVLVILVIVSAVVISKRGALSTDLVAQSEILKTHLRHAQTIAMGGTDSNSIFGIKCDTAFYWMFKGTDPDSNIMWLPDNQEYNTNNDNKLDLNKKKVDIAGAFTLFFDNRGIPYSAYTDETSNTPLSSDLTINVTPDGAGSPLETITVTQHTGFIP